MGFKTAASEEDVLSPISVAIKTHFGGCNLCLMLSLTFTDGAVYSLTHLTALTWITPRIPAAASHRLNSYPGYVCMSIQRPIYPVLHTKGRNSSWVLPCSSCSTHCLHLLSLETLTVTPVHSGTQRQPKEPSALAAPAWEGTAILQPSLLLSHTSDSRKGSSCGVVLSILHSMVVLGERENHLLGTIMSFIPTATSSKFLNISEHFGHCHKLVPA